jgi:hypothetical protein
MCSEQVIVDYEAFINNLNTIKSDNFLKSERGLAYFDFMYTTYKFVKVHLKCYKFKQEVSNTFELFEEGFIEEFFGTGDLKEAEKKFQVIEKLINEIIKDNKIVVDKDDDEF